MWRSPRHRSRGCPIETKRRAERRFRPMAWLRRSRASAAPTCRSSRWGSSGSSSSTSMRTGRLYFASRSVQSAWRSSALTARRARRRRSDDLAEDVVGSADDGAWSTPRGVEGRLDLLRVDVLAAADDHVLDAVDDPQVAVLVEDADVAGVQPAVGDRLDGVGGPVEIAAHDVGAADDHLAPLACGSGLPTGSTTRISWPGSGSPTVPGFRRRRRGSAWRRTSPRIARSPRRGRRRGCARRGR